MSCIVYQTKNGVKYAYKSESYWDKEKHQPRSKRTYLGRVDPATGEIISKKEPHAGSAKGACGQSESGAEDLRRELLIKDGDIRALKEALEEKDAVLGRLLENMKKIRALAGTEFSGMDSTEE